MSLHSPSTHINSTDVAAVGDVYHLTAHSLVHGAGAGIDRNATHTGDHEKWILAASTDTLIFPIAGLAVGDMIPKFHVRCAKNTGAVDLSARLIEMSAGSSTTKSTATISDLAPGTTVIHSADLEVPVAAGKSFAIEILPSGSVAPGADRIFSVEVDACRPYPGWFV